MEHSPFLPLLLITVLAFVVPLLSARLRRISLPIVVGEILAGIIIGKSGFNFVVPSEILDFLGEFGFAFLMFLSGLEIDFNLLTTGRYGGEEPLWKRPLPTALLLFAGTLLLGLLAGMGLASVDMVQSPLLMGLILSTTSLGIVVPVLKERDLLGSRFGQAILVEASIADFVTLILLTIVIALNSTGLELDLLLIAVLLLAFLLFARVAQEAAAAGPIRRVLREISSATAQIRVRGAFALLVGWVVVAEALGVELILGAFLAGAILGLVTDSDSSAAREKLEAIGYGFFIPVFFILVGVDFNLPALVESERALLLVPLLLVGSFLVKLLPSLLLRFQFSWRETLSGGVLLSSRLSLIIAAAAIAVDIGAITDAVNSAVILLAILTTTVSPFVFNRIVGPKVAESRRGIILVGSDQMTEFLGRRLHQYHEEDETAVILCSNQRRYHALRRSGLDVLTLTGDLAESLRKAGAESARALVDLSDTEQDSIALCRMALKVFDMPEVISRISEVEAVPQLQSMGVRVVQPALATAMALEGALRYPTAFDVLVHKAEEVEVGEVTLRNLALSGIKVKDLDLPGNALILSLQRENTVMVPHADTALRVGDRIDLIGSPEAIDRSVAMLRG